MGTEKDVEHLTLGAGVNWQSGTRTQVASPSGEATFNQGEVTQVSLMARYQFTPNVSLQFNGNNIFDKKYYVLDQFDNTYYGAPASGTLTLRYAFDDGHPVSRCRARLREGRCRADDRDPPARE